MTAAQGLALVASYLLGAIPTSYLVARAARGIDLRDVGSKSLGATNLYRALGWKYAVPVALFDAAKGTIPVLVIAPRASHSELFALLCGITAVAGHVFPVFVRFKGGKGVATAAGVMAALSPLPLLICLVVWIVVVRVTGYVSLGSIVAAALLPVLVFLLQPERHTLAWLAALLACGIIWLHRANIGRLLRGTENRFGRRAAAGPTS